MRAKGRKSETSSGVEGIDREEAIEADGSGLPGAAEGDGLGSEAAEDAGAQPVGTAEAGDDGRGAGGVRMAQRAAGEVESWVHAMRKLVGMPVEELAGRMGVLRWEVYRMEKSEREGRIGLWKLRETAKAMDCELVYALVPRAGTLEQLVARREEARAKAEAVRREGAEKKLETMGGRMRCGGR